MELKIKYYFIHHAYLNLLLLLNHFSRVQLCATLWTAATRLLCSLGKNTGVGFHFLLLNLL